MKKSDVVSLVLADRYLQAPQHAQGKAFAPTNIALCKYWGKRDQELNLPVTSSLSVSLGEKGASALLNIHDAASDKIILNGIPVNMEVSFSQRLIKFLDLFRSAQAPKFSIEIESNIPIAAGLASSAAGFASIVKALDDLYGWQLSATQLSILARLGSGSAARSLWQGFVEWQLGERADGMDSYGEPIANVWPELCLGLMIFSDREKEISSREAMQRTVATSPLYCAWPAKVNDDLQTLRQAIAEKDFALLGKTAESNATTMHATMFSAWPPVSYALPETLLMMKKVWDLRADGLPIYFTQDAGPNLKLLFLKTDIDAVKKHFPQVEVLQLF